MKSFKEPLANSGHVRLFAGFLRALAVLSFGWLIMASVHAQAPSALAGTSIGIEVTSGTLPFATFGYYIFLPASNGSNYQVIGIDNVLNSAGTYGYFATGAIGEMNLVDSALNLVSVTLQFSTATSGSFYATNVADAAYQSGTFQTFSGQVLASIAGETVECTIQDGLYPFAQTGSFVFKAASSGNKFTVVGDGVNTAGSSGTYSFSKLNATTGMIYTSDPQIGAATIYFAFSTLSTGRFTAISSAVGGFQIGSFSIVNPGSLPVTANVTVSGTGSVSPNISGKILRTGKTCTLTAVSGSGQIFSNWSGGIASLKNPLTFVLQSNLTLQANFIPNPFLAWQGMYNGLFTPTNGVTEQTAGMLKSLVITRKGVYSGKLLFGGGSHSVSGTFNLSGQATNNISLQNIQGGPLTMAMAIQDFTNGTFKVTGKLSGTINGIAWTADLLAFQAATAFPSGNYDLLIGPDTNNAPPLVSPGGDGYALIACKQGTGTISGMLADGTPFNQTTSVSSSGDIPVYVSLYANKGFLFGWINLHGAGSEKVGLTWFHPPRSTGLYQSGFTNVVLSDQVLVSPWLNPSASIGNITQLLISDTFGLTNASVPVSILNSGKITGSSTVGNINLKTGLFTVATGTGSAKIVGHGAILLNSTNGGGFFITKVKVGAIELDQ